MTRNQAMGLMVFCLLVAAAIRFPGLNHTPPPIHYDEAANGVILREIAFAGYRPVFIPSYTGKDVLFFYLAGAVTRLGGSSVFTMRYTSALIGLLTIAATYWLGRELIRKRSVALVAAAILTVTFWHILFSRLGFRAISEPLLQALAVAALWRGLRRNQWRWLVLAGLFLGLTAYTYLSARLFPVPLGLSLLVFFFNRQQRARRWEQIGVIIAVAFLVLIPLLLYFRQNPDAFWVRITQVAPTTERQLTVGQSLLKSLGMLFIEGDPYWRYNDPGRPVFNWVWGGFLLAGVWLNVRLLFRARWDWQRAGWLLLLLTPPIMLLPTALATGEIVPSNIRAIGILPFVMFWPALGADWLVHDVVQPRRPAWINRVIAGVVVLTVLIQGGLMANWYFRHWANRVDLFYESDGDMASAAAWLDTYDTENKTIYAAAKHYRHPTAAFLSQKYGQIHWLPGSEALVWPETGPSLVIYPHNSPAPAWAAPMLSQAKVISGTLGPDNLPAFRVYEWASPPAIAVSYTVEANFAHVITLVGYTVDSREEDVLDVNLLWRVLNQPAAAYMPFIHLEDQWGYRWSQAESFAYPSEQWQPGDTIWQHITLPVPPGTPPGAYRLQIGLFNPDNNERLAHLDEVGRFAGTTVALEGVMVAAANPPTTLPQPSFPLNQTILSQLTLIGYEDIPAVVETGAPLNVSLWWQATTYLPPLTIRFELFRPDGFGKILRDTQPVHGSFPFTDWPAPLFLQDHQTLFIPPDLPAGLYRLNLRVLGTADESLYAHELGEITITATERLFDPPDYESPVNAHFGDEITLLGYDWQVNTDIAHLTLIWQADRVPTADYAVFVHLLDANGFCCAWQSDLAPRQGSYPTTRWLAGEVVIDEYDIPLADLPPGTYPLELGFYLPQTGQRLLATLRDGTTSDAILLEALEREGGNAAASGPNTDYWLLATLSCFPGFTSSSRLNSWLQLTVPRVRGYHPTLLALCPLQVIIQLSRKRFWDSPSILQSIANRKSKIVNRKCHNNLTYPMRETDLEKIEVSLFLQALYQRHGHDFRHYAQASVRRRVRRLMTKKGVSHVSDLIPLLLHDEHFAEEAVHEFSITVTEMFRDPLFYQVVREKIVSYLQTFPFIKVWHAGCATGEEVYSLAILLQEEGLYDRATIFATDFNEVALQRAQEGIYPLKEMRQHTTNYQRAGGRKSFADYYHAQYDSARLDQSLKRNITFANHNLVTDGVFSEVHLVFCRNVLIYFDRTLQNHVLQLLTQSLSLGGFLCLGLKESIHLSEIQNRFRVVDEKARIYQKQTVQ